MSHDVLMCEQVNIAAMRVACSIHGLRPPVKGVPGTVTALVPGTGELALAGEGALLQVFDAGRNRHVDKVQVCLCTIFIGTCCVTGYCVKQRHMQKL